MANLDQQFEEATRRGEQTLAGSPKAKAVSYDRQTKRLIVDLQSGITFMIPVNLVQIFDGATDAQIADVEPAIDGLYLRWKSLDEDLSVPNLLSGIFGTRKWMNGLSNHLAAIGAKGGSAKSAAKSKSSAENGKRGGRPRKERTA